MKKFLVILLALALVVAFSMPAGAADVKFKGSYYVRGYYVDNRTLGKDQASDQFYAQRFRLTTIFKVAEGLKFTTRFDAMERIWAQNRYESSPKIEGVKTQYKKEDNLSWERAYVTFAVPFGQFDVGYQSASYTQAPYFAFGGFGTRFGTATGSQPAIKYTGKFGPWIAVAKIVKYAENDFKASATDLDTDKYQVGAIYKWDAGSAGLFYQYVRDASNKNTSNYTTNVSVLSPYAKAKFGPVYVEGQAFWAFGKAEEYEDGGTDVDAEGRAAYIMAKYGFGPGAVGAMFQYVRGDDPNTADADEGTFNGGADMSPCLIMLGEKYSKWVGPSSLNPYTDGNYLFYQVFADYKVMPKLKLASSLSYATADEKPAGYRDDDYGTEFDISATYKIYNNLSYKIGFGYLWTGDYYKGSSTSPTEVDDNYVIVNHLQLKF